MKKILIVFLLVSLLSISAQAGIVTLTGVDNMGTSSFNSAGQVGDPPVANWSDSSAPSAGNDYYVPNGTRLRTPADGSSYTFAGDSLHIDNTSAYGDGFMYKGTGTAGTITVDNLILGGGLISHANGSADRFNLAGNMNVASDSRLYAKQGVIDVQSVISGTAQLTILASDQYGCELIISSSANTYTGNIVNHGRFTLADDAVLNFVIGADGVNNSVSDGGSQQHTFYYGDFNFDLSAASTTVGDSWKIDDTTRASTYYHNNGSETFSVIGFTDVGTAWLGQANGAWYYYSEATQTLTCVPEPATMMLLGLGSLALIRRKRA